MFDMIDVIQMSNISKHYLLEYQMLLESYEMQASNVTNGFRVLDFSDDISDEDYTSDDWSVNESYSESSGERANSVQAKILPNPPEYSVSAGSKPLSIIIRRCITPSVAPSPVQEVNKENSCRNGSSAPPAHCDVADVFNCKKTQTFGRANTGKDMKCSISEPTNIVNVCDEDYKLCEDEEENLSRSEHASCKSTNEEFPDVISAGEDSNEEKNDNLQVCVESLIEQNEQSSVPVVTSLPFVNNMCSINIKNSSLCCENDKGKNNLNQKDDDLGLLDHGCKNLVSAECDSYLVVDTNNVKNGAIDVPKEQTSVANEVQHCKYNAPSNYNTYNFHGSPVEKGISSFTDETAENIEVKRLTSSYCCESNELALVKDDIVNCVGELSMCQGESSDAFLYENIDTWRQLSCSPLLFSSDDESSSITEEVNRGIEAALAPSPEYSAVLSCEKKKVGKLQELLMGAPPPPAVTMPLYSASDMLEVLKSTSHWTAPQAAGSLCSIVMPWDQQVSSTPWPQVKCLQYPGIHYNHGTVSEQFESLCQKLLARCVGAETASSVTVWSSFMLPAPRRERKMLTAHRTGSCAPTGLSPGRRLSHLARRHRTFSSATLLMDGARLHSALPHAVPERRTILVESRKRDSRKQRSSQKKKSDHHDRTRDVHPLKLNSSKRALFQSPTEEGKKASVPSKFRASSASAVRSRRALFVPEPTESRSRSPGSSLSENANVNRKRSRAGSEKAGCERLPRRRLFSDAESSDARPTTSDGSTRQAELSSTHKKKLLWAVAEALKKHGVGLAHPQFRACAAALAAMCRCHVQQLLALRQGSTSDRMLQLALRFVDEAVTQHIKAHPQGEYGRCNEVG